METKPQVANEVVAPALPGAGGRRWRALAAQRSGTSKNNVPEW